MITTRFTCRPYMHTERSQNTTYIHTSIIYIHTYIQALHTYAGHTHKNTTTKNSNNKTTIQPPQTPKNQPKKQRNTSHTQINTHHLIIIVIISVYTKCLKLMILLFLSCLDFLSIFASDIQTIFERSDQTLLP